MEIQIIIVDVLSHTNRIKQTFGCITTQGQRQQQQQQQQQLVDTSTISNIHQYNVIRWKYFGRDRHGIVND